MSVPACAVDTSALLAFISEEPGWTVAEGWLEHGAAASALVVQELVSKLVQRGVTREVVVETVGTLNLMVVDLTLPLAVEAGAMFALTRPAGLSHGDRACLALARSLDVPAVTADRAWARVADDLGVRVELIR